MEMEIREINNICDSELLGLFWKGNEYFPPDNIDDNLRKTIEQLCCIEVVFSKDKIPNNSSLDLFDFYGQFLNEYFRNIKDEYFLVKTEHKKQIPNKVRSYKGLIPKEYRNESYLIDEVHLDGNYTIILSSINPKGEHLKELLDFFVDRNTCCILSKYSDRKDFLKTFSEKYMVHDSISRIRYKDLVIDYCMDGEIIYRIGGDGGQENVTLQIFCLKKHKQKILDEIKPLMIS